MQEIRTVSTYIHLVIHFLEPFSHTLCSETNLKVRQALSETHDRFVLDSENGPQLLKEELNKFDGAYVNTCVHTYVHAMYHTVERLRGEWSSPELSFIVCRVHRV